MNIISRIVLSIILLLSGCSAKSKSDNLTPLREVPLPPIDQRFPVKNDADSIKDAYFHPQKWDGISVAVQGTIISIVLNSKGQPSVELSLDKDGQTTIWAMFALHLSDESFLQVGQQIRVMGWMRDSKNFADAIHSDLPTNDTMVLLPICLVKIPISSAIYDSKYQEYCGAWRKGYMAENLQH